MITTQVFIASPILDLKPNLLQFDTKHLFLCLYLFAVLPYYIIFRKFSLFVRLHIISRDWLSLYKVAPDCLDLPYRYSGC